MSQHVETMRAALHEIGEHHLADGLKSPGVPGARFMSPGLNFPEQTITLRKASLIALISLEGPSAKVKCATHRCCWHLNGPRPPSWDQCAQVAAWQMLHDPTTVCANTPRRP